MVMFSVHLSTAPRDIATSTANRKIVDVNDFTVTRGNSIQPGKLKRLKCPTFGTVMLYYKADLKMREL